MPCAAGGAAAHQNLPATSVITGVSAAITQAVVRVQVSQRQPGTVEEIRA
jgi:hypothetical protein